MANIEEYRPSTGRVIKEDGNIINIADLGELSLGQIGSKAITGTNAVTPDSGYYFACIQAIADIVVSAQGNVTGSTNAVLSSFPKIPAGTVVYGKWDSITLTSGEAIGYYKAV